MHPDPMRFIPSSRPTFIYGPIVLSTKSFSNMSIVLLSKQWMRPDLAMGPTKANRRQSHEQNKKRRPRLDAEGLLSPRTLRTIIDDMEFADAAGMSGIHLMLISRNFIVITSFCYYVVRVWQPGDESARNEFSAFSETKALSAFRSLQKCILRILHMQLLQKSDTVIFYGILSSHLFSYICHRHARRDSSRLNRENSRVRRVDILLLG